MEEAEDLIRRAAIALGAARFSPLARVTSLEYARIAARTAAAMAAAGPGWTGISSMGGAASTQASRRAAWSRRSHQEVAAALHDLRERKVTVADALCRLRTWVPEAEATPACPEHVPAPGTGAKRPTTKSKRHSLRSLPADWMDRIWSAASCDYFRHRDEIAVLLVTGCRPSEAAWGVDVVADSDDVVVHVAGAKTTADTGQPWRRLRVQASAGPAAYLRERAQAAGGIARLRPSCSPAALSMAVADLGTACHLPGRISAYTIRHQRAADARNAFAGDMDQLAAWLGHSAASTARHYGRLPRSTGSRGPMPLDAEAPRPIRHRVRSPEPVASPAP